MNKYNLPYNVLRNPNSWDKAPRDPMTIGNFLLSTVGIQATSTAFIYAVGFTATTLVTAAVSRALMPSMPSYKDPGMIGNFRQSAAPWDIIYGQTRKGGTITYMESTGNENKYLHMIITLAGHEVEEIGDVYINDQVVTIGTDNYVSSSPWDANSGIKAIYVQKFTGSPTQDVYSVLSALPNGDGQRPKFENEDGSNTPSNFKGQGIACLYVRMEYNRDIFAGGIPSFSAVIKGKRVYDPRTGSTAYSANAALCIRDYLVSEYGLNTPEYTIDDTFFSTAANDCDTSSGSGADNKFEINGVIRTSKNIRTNLQDMVGACVGSLYYSVGKFKLIAGVYSSPVKTLTIDDLRSEVSVNTRLSRRDNFNSVQGTFLWAGVDDGTGSGGDWMEVDYPAITSEGAGGFLEEDNGYENPLQLDLPLTTNSATAQRIAKQVLFRSREQISVTADFGMNAFDLEVGDVIQLTLDRYGWTNKEFEVVGWGFKADQEAGDLRVTLNLKETSSDAFAWNAEEQQITTNNSVLASFNEVQQPSFVGTPTTTTVLNPDGTTVSYGTVQWSVTDPEMVSYYIFRYKRGSGQEQSFRTDNNYYEISSVVINQQYTVEVLAVNHLGVRSPATSATITFTADTTAPSVPAISSTEPGYTQNTINFVLPSDKDFKEVEVYANTSNTTSGASLIGKVSGSSFVHAGLPQNTTRYYFAKSVDFTGNTSAFSSGVAATTLSNPQDGQDGADGTDGTDGANGDTVITGRVYYQTLQSTSPGTPSATSYNASTGLFTGLTAGWSQTQPAVDITDTSVQEWSSQFTVTIDGVTSAQTINFTSPTGAIQVAADIESDNYVAGASGWKIARDTGFAEFGAATIRGTLTADQIQIDNITLDSDASNNLIIKTAGVDTGQIALNAVSVLDGFVSQTTSVYNTWRTVVTLTLTGLQTSGTALNVNIGGTIQFTTAIPACQLGFRILRNGSVYKDFGAGIEKNAGFWQMPSINYLVANNTSTTTIALQVFQYNATGSTGTVSASMLVTELKR